MPFINKKNFFRIVSIILVLLTFLPLVGNNLPPIIGSYHLYAILWIVSTIIFEPRIYHQKIIIIFILYGLFYLLILQLLLWRYMDDWNREAIQNEYYNIFIPLTVYYYYRVNNDYIGWANLVKLALIFIGITAIMTFIASSFNPMYARNITAGEIIDNELDFFNRIGGGTYGYAIALLGLFPLLIYYFKNNYKIILQRKFIVLYGTIIYFAIIRMQFFANILLSSLIIIIATLGTQNKKRSLIVFASLIFITVIIPKITYSELLMQASSWFKEDSETYYKLNDMANYIIGETEDNTTEQRAARYPELLEAFIKSPIIGDASYHSGLDIGLGAHLYWMNRLAIWGLIGFSFYLWIHYKYIFSVVKYFDSQFAYYFLLSVGVILFYGIIKNIAGREVWYAYFVILPGMYYFPTLKKKETDNRSK